MGQHLSEEEKQRIEEEERIRAEAQARARQQQGGVSHNYIVVLLLCLFLGTLGIHRFYVGKNGSGVAMLLLSLTIIGLIISAPWALIDLIMIATRNFKDGEGNYITS